MNNKRYTYKWLLLIPMLMFFSCTQEDLPGTDKIQEYDGISFLVSMADNDTRSTGTTGTGSLTEGFQVSAICPEDDEDPTKEYFSNLSATPIGDTDKGKKFGIFNRSAEQCVWPTLRHGKEGRLKFFAFYPSLESLSKHAGGKSGETSDNSEKNYFVLENNSSLDGSDVKYDYRIKNFKVNKDISKHVDFVAATTEGSRKENEESGVNLDFEHQLSRVAFKVWGNLDNTEISEIEIAGVRIGRAIVESDFNFAATPKDLAAGDRTVSGDWVGPQVKDHVEYILSEGESVIKLGGKNYKTAGEATPIMGDGNWAMVIPANYTGWKYKTDCDNSDQGLYISVLLRVIGKEEHNPLLYPYVEIADLTDADEPYNGSDMNVVYLSVYKDTGKVYKRLYRHPDTKQFFEDPDFKTPYTRDDKKSNHNYGWAAIPLDAVMTPQKRLLWKPGYQYSYTFDYSKGVGLEDPDDLFPGDPIISKIEVGVTEKVSQGNKEYWHTVQDYENEDLPLLQK